MKKLSDNSYPGRGIIVGKSQDGKCVIAYFATGRSANSRNRIIVPDKDGAKTKAFDPSLLTDPSLVIYNAVKTYNRFIIITNGDHTDTIHHYLTKGYSYQKALNTREFEPDSPIFTPRIAAAVELKDSDFSFDMAILRPDKALPPRCLRDYYRFETLKRGEGKIIHTYLSDGNPPPIFDTQPRDIEISGGIADFSERLWKSLNNVNRIFLFVRFIDTVNKEYTNKIINALEV